MREDIKKRIEAVRQGEVPEGYSADRAMLFPNEWGEPVALNTVLTENKTRNEDLRFGKEDVLSVSGEQGVVNQISLLGRSYAGESVAPYHVVETGDVVYTKSPLKENPYGIIKQNRGVPGIVSTLYAVYHCDSPITGQYLENYFCIDTYLNNYLKPLVKRGAKNDMKVNNEEVLLGRIPLPTLQEQERINGIIAQFDRVIELKQQLLEEKRRQKQWLMQMLLDPNSGVRQSACSNVKWITYGISDLGTVITGSTPDKSCDKFWGGDFPWITSQDFNGKYISTAEAHVTEAGKKKCRVLPAGAVLVTCIASIGLNAIAQVDCVTNQQINAVICNGICSEEMLYYIVEYNRGTLERLAGKTAVPIISKAQFEKIKVTIPEARFEQDKITKVLSAADREIQLLQSELEMCQQKKKALMQLLLTGLVRVNA